MFIIVRVNHMIAYFMAEFKDKARKKLKNRLFERNGEKIHDYRNTFASL